MDMQQALRARIIAATGMAALVGTRVYWIDRPQLSALPSITLQIISGERSQTHDSISALRQNRVQLDIWAETYASAQIIAEAVIANLTQNNQLSNGINFNQIKIDDESDSLEQTSTTKIYRARLDLIVWHSPA